MNLALNAPTRLRFAGRSFLAFVLQPVPPVSEWLADLDAVAKQSMGFFANRPVILDLSALAPSETETKAILTKLKSRSIRVISVEGVEAAWVGPALAPLSGGIETSAVVDLSSADETVEEPAAAAATEAPAAPGAPESLLLEQPVRSGKSIFGPHGDVTVIGSVASGAEVVAGGNVHVYGALRGRAIAGAMGNANARIFCRKFEAELVAIDGCYMTAEMVAPEVIRKPVQISLANTSIHINVFG